MTWCVGRAGFFWQSGRKTFLWTIIGQKDLPENKAAPLVPSRNMYIHLSQIYSLLNVLFSHTGAPPHNSKVGSFLSFYGIQYSKHGEFPWALPHPSFFAIFLQAIPYPLAPIDKTLAAHSGLLSSNLPNKETRVRKLPGHHPTRFAVALLLM